MSTAIQLVPPKPTKFERHLQSKIRSTTLKLLGAVAMWWVNLSLVIGGRWFSLVWLGVWGLWAAAFHADLTLRRAELATHRAAANSYLPEARIR